MPLQSKKATHDRTSAKRLASSGKQKSRATSKRASGIASGANGLDADHEIGFTVVLAAKAPLSAIHSEGPVRRTLRAEHLSHAELRHTYGAVPGAVKLVESFARKFNLKVVEQLQHRRSLRLRGRLADVEQAFHTSFREFEQDGRKFFAPIRPLNKPAAWDGAVEAVLGLHGSPHAWPRRRSAVHGLKAAGSLHNLAQAYAFPQELDGLGQTIGLIEFAGGFYPEDIAEFCSRIGVPKPRITVVEIGSGANKPASRREVHKFLDVVNGKLTVAKRTEESDPFFDAQCTAEVTMDIEILAALAPKAHIVVYFASSDEQSQQGLYHAISHAVHDEEHRPGILSLSWSMPEHTFTEPEIQAIEGVLREAAHLGITVCASSGDNGALNGSTDGKPSVNYPASSPHCLACGGTSGKMGRTGIAEEVVWNASHHGIKGASGGGISQQFKVPAWQRNSRVPVGPSGKRGRGVPDVAGLADPRYGCELLVAGRPFASAGTSAVAPMWAALVARLNQALGRRCGHLHPHIYHLGKERKAALRAVLKGNNGPNGLYQAGPGWNACTGYGTPRGEELLAYLKTRLDS